MQNKTNKPEIKNIEVFDFDTYEDNSAMIDFEYNGVNYFEFIRPKDVERCANENGWLVDTCPEGETIEIDFEAFMEKNQDGHSQFELKHAIELAAFYLKETNN